MPTRSGTTADSRWFAHRAPKHDVAAAQVFFGAEKGVEAAISRRTLPLPLSRTMVGSELLHSRC